jgi:hypothetical protein
MGPSGHGEGNRSVLAKTKSIVLLVLGVAEVFACVARALAVGPAEVQITVDTSHPAGPIDLTRYALGQGGLSNRPMISDRVQQIRQLHPQTIRLFVQEYFELYPAHHQYHWATLDKTIEAILATGAKPIMNICFKPKVLYPTIDDKIVDPTSYPEWDELIYRLVKHCNQDRHFGIEYWEISNEGDIGEPGGSPYKFTPQNYVAYYQHTVSAIRRADPAAKVGGPALANYRSPIGDALIDFCGQGKAPLDFLSWHMYTNDPRDLWRSIETMKAKLAKYPQLNNVETILDEWNMSLRDPVLRPDFQPAFILETTQGFYRDGLSRSAYYHIRDYFVDPKLFSPFMSPHGTMFMAHWWNVMPQYDGLYDNQDRVRPAYYAFKLLSLIKGQRISTTGANADVEAFAARNGPWVNLVLWNFPLEGSGQTYDVTVDFPEEKTGGVRLVRLDPDAPLNNLEQIRNGSISDLSTDPLRVSLHPYGIYWVELTESR